jgi:alpha-ketoglutarate-dependent 2,4-dichlorophenoxyacetate dioxygenase
MGGQTEFVDTRQAWDTLPDRLKQKLLARDHVANHSMFHSKKLAAPDHFADVDVEALGFGRHRLVQKHEPSGRTSIYLAAHIHHLDDMPREESELLVKELMDHATEAENVLQVEWENVGDLVIWDNTCLMHRAVGGDFVNKYRRDMRRVTVHDMSSSAWGLNERSDKRQGLP